jgi:glycosyltransferase involved in cell wall biosynthesis
MNQACASTSVKRPRLLLTGLEYFVHQLVESVFSSDECMVLAPRLNQVSSRFRRLTVILEHLFRVDLWYQIGGYAGRGRIYKLANMLGVPVVLHWVGSDVLAAQRYFDRHPEHLPSEVRLTHWAGAPWLVDELKRIGINARFVPLPLKTVGTFLSREPPPLPKNFKITTYLSDQRPTFYGWDHILRLAKDFPDIEIIVIGSTGSFVRHHPPNVRFLGWVSDTFPVFADCTVVVRMTEHDGYGGTVQEALSLGRYAIWTYPFPGASVAEDYSSLCRHVNHLYKLHKKGRLFINEAGRTYMLENMHPKYLAAKIAQGLRHLLKNTGASYG